jgi:hypothetical protein
VHMRAIHTSNILNMLPQSCGALFKSNTIVLGRITWTGPIVVHKPQQHRRVADA